MELKLKLFAHIPSGEGWAFFVADEASGLKLPIVRDLFAIWVSRDCIALECAIDLDLAYDNFLELKFSGGELSCDQGFLKLLEPAYCGMQHGKEIINCTIMLDGFSGKEAE